VARVFVSHARKDLVLAREWHQRLIEAGHKVFLAHDLRDGITVGEEWEQRLRRELRLTDAVVCAITPAYLASRVCTDEVMLAQFWGRPLFPVQAEPDVVHPRLTNLQHIGLAGARHQLIDALRRIDAAALPDDRPLAGPAGVHNRRRTGGAASVQQFTSYDEPVPCGRHSDAAQLLTWLDPMEPGGPTTIAVTGLPGVGKTTLARYACSKAMDRFRGGAVYLNMNGYDPDPQARTAAEEVYGPLLLALGVDSWYGISDSDAGHAGAVYHRKLAEWSEQGRSVLLMLDNVSGF
jgi:TIR domain